MMPKWKVLTMFFGLLGALGALFVVHPGVVASAYVADSVITNHSKDGPLSYTVKTSADGTPVWVTIVPKGHTISQHVIETEPWWKWGNTLTDIYFIAVGHPTDVEMLLQFQEQPNGAPKVRVYGDVAGHKQIQYTWLKTQAPSDTTSTYTLQILTLDGVQTIDMAPTKGTSWVVNGHPNYDVQLLSDMNLHDDPARNELVGSSGTDAPQWQTSEVANDPHPDWSYDRFGAFERMQGAPPFEVEETFMPSFPYIGIHYGQPEWFKINPNPFYFNTKTYAFTEEPFVGFQEGGIYQLNSVASTPHVDFESPFAFYNFDPKTRYAQLVIRAQNYNANDPYFYYPTSKNLQTYRYSWSIGTNGIWDYGLTLGGFRSFPGTLHIGNSNVTGVAPKKLPQWTINHPWDTVTLDQAMNGYSGSEGIYFYSVQSPLMSAWMLGFLNQPPKYLAHPDLPDKVELDTTSTISVPLGFRDEYSASYFHSPVLYASPIDQLVHLLRPSGGIYHFSKTQILRTDNLDDGMYINSWTVETIPTKHTPTQVIEQLASVDGYLLYSGLHGVLIRQANFPPSVFTIQPPTDKASWKAYVASVKPYQQGRDPHDLYKWFQSFSGPTEQITGAKMRFLQANKGGFSFELTIGHVVAGTRIKGLPIQSGRYMVNYNTATHEWHYTPARVPSINGDIKLVGQAQAGHLSRYVMQVHNSGNVPWTGTITAYAGHELIYHGELTLNGGDTFQQTLGWTPEQSGSYNLRILEGNQVFVNKSVEVASDSQLRYDWLLHQGRWSAVHQILLLSLLLGLGSVAATIVLLSSRQKEYV